MQSTFTNTPNNKLTSKSDAAEELYQVGISLIEKTKGFVERMAIKESSASEIHKQGVEIMQYGFNYLKLSTENNKVTKYKKTLVLLKYAVSVMEKGEDKERCEDKIVFMEKELNELLPENLYDEVTTISENIVACKNRIQKNVLYSSITAPYMLDGGAEDRLRFAFVKALDISNFLNQCKKPLQSIKEKMGECDSFYLHISEYVVSFALEQMVESINQWQKDMDRLSSWKPLYSITKMKQDFYSGIAQFYTTLEHIQKFDLSIGFIENKVAPIFLNVKRIKERLEFAKRITEAPLPQKKNDGCISVLLLCLVILVVCWFTIYS